MRRFEPLRVALATDSLDPSGVGEHMLTLGRELHADHEVILAFPVGTAGSMFLSRASALGLGVKELSDDADDNARWLQMAGVDLLHVHAGIGWEGHELAWAGQSARVPVVRTEHLPYLITDPVQKDEHRAGLDWVQGVITVSGSSAHTYRRAGIDGDKLCTIRNGVHAPVPAIQRNIVRGRLGIGKHDQLILTVARFTRQKGHPVLLAAMDDLAPTNPRCKLVLVGDGEERSGMQRVAAELGLSDRVLFLGERSDVPDLLAASDLFVLPSLFEGLPLAVLEAMALAVPIVATRIGGVVEALGEEHPWYADPHDAASLGAVIEEALGDADARRTNGLAGQRRFRDHYQASRMGRETAAIYRKIKQSAPAEIGKSRQMKKTHIGFIGAGGIAQRHLGVLEQFDDVVLSAFADTDLGRAEDAARRFGARAFASHSEMLRSTELDAVYICVPPFAHGDAEREVMAKRLPFFVEKPLSLDIGLAERIAGEVARKGIVTAVGYHWRYLDIVDEARDRLADNPAQLMSGYWLDQTPPPQWWWKDNQSGGQMVEQATHIIDLARYLAGDVVQVFGMAGHKQRAQFSGLDVATASTASLRFASGAIANIGATCLLGWGHRIGLHVFADRLALELSDRELMVDVGAGRPVRHAEGDPVWREDRDFIDAVRGGENRIRCPYHEALETHRVALAIAESAATGIPISFETRLAEAANG